MFQKNKRLKTLFYMADGELVAALLVGNDQLNEVKLKNHLGADFFDVASEEEVANLVQAGFGSLGPVGSPENCKNHRRTVRCKMPIMPVDGC